MSGRAFLSELVASSEGIEDLTHRHISYTLFQLLCKVARFRTTGLVHGNICPENVAISRDGTLELLEEYAKPSKLSYKAPEVLLEMPVTSEADIWSIGVVFGEMMNRKAFFQTAEDRLRQWTTVVETLGSPNPRFYNKVPLHIFTEIVRVPRASGKSPYELLPFDKCSAKGDKAPLTFMNAVDLLGQMLVIDPDERITAEEALQHPYMSRIMLGLQVSDEHADLADLSHFELLMKQATEVVQAAKKLQNSQQYKNLFPNGGIYEKVKFGAAILELEDCLNNKDIAVISFYGALPALRNELLQLYGKVAPPSYGYLPERTAVFISHETAIVEVKQASESLASPALSHFDIWMKHAADVVQAAKKLQNSQQYKDLFPNGGAYEKAYVKLGTGILDLEHCLKNKDTAVNSFYAALPALRNELLKLYGMIAPPSYGYLPVLPLIMDITEIIDLANETVEVPDHLQKTSAEVRRRVCALKQLQVEAYKAQAAFNAKVYELEAQLAAIYTQIGEKRAAIVNGQYEPSNEEATAPLLHVVERTGLAELEREWNNNNPNRGQVGVPDFWLNVIKGNATFAGMITEQDEPILKHLVDLTYTVDLNPQAFTLIFKFAPNNGYFTNTELTKRYEITTDVDDKEPFFYAGPRCLSIDGTHINWLHGKDVTVDGDGHLQQSVFNFFKVAGKRDGLPESALADFELDYEFGEAIRDQIIPRAVLYYTGEAEEADSDYDSCEEDSDEDSDDEETITIEDMDE